MDKKTLRNDMKYKSFQRHEIYRIRQDRKEDVFSRGIDSLNRDMSEWKQSIIDNDLPLYAMVRRFDENEHRACIPVGISSHLRDKNGHRFRMFNYLNERDIDDKISPYDVIRSSSCSILNGPMSQLINDLLVTGNRLHLDIGVYGSVAYEILTNRKYIDDNSDVDILVKCIGKNNPDNLKQFFSYIIQKENITNRRIDCELEVSHGKHVNLKEILLSKAETVLLKQIDSVSIICNTDVFNTDVCHAKVT